MEEPDHYRVLQIDPRAEPEIVQAAYRRLAAKYHPDVNPDAPEMALRRMQQINAAYHVLSDPQRRADYDLGRRKTGRRTGGHTTHARDVPPRRQRPRFRVDPDHLEFWDVDPTEPRIVMELTLIQMAGSRFDPRLDVLEFTLSPDFRGCRSHHQLLARDRDDDVRARLTLELPGLDKERTHIGSVNVSGDPSARFSISVGFRPEPQHGYARKTQDIPRRRQRPRFRVDPAHFEFLDIDPTQPRIFIEVTLIQVAGSRFDPHRDFLDFTLSPNLQGHLSRLEMIARDGDEIRVGLTLELPLVNRERSHFGTINVFGDPSARFSITVGFLRRPPHRRTTTDERSSAGWSGGSPSPRSDSSDIIWDRTRPTSSADSKPLVRGYARSLLSVALLWLLKPLKQPLSTASALGVSIRMAAVAGVVFVGWVALPYLLQALLWLVAVLGLFFLLVIAGNGWSGSRGSAAKRGGRRRRRR